MSAEDERGAWVDAALPLALTLVGAVRDYDADVVDRVLAEVQQLDRPDDLDPLVGLAVALAALVPDDRSARDLLGWTGQTSPGQKLTGRDAIESAVSDRTFRVRTSLRGAA